MKKTVLVIFLLAVLTVLAGNSEAATYNCTNCTNCTATIANAASGDIINLVNNISYNLNCITYNTSDTTFDCLNNIITGVIGRTGISIINKTNITIQNCNINNFTNAILLIGNYSVPTGVDHDVHNCNLYNNTRGINAMKLTNNSFYSNNIYDNDYGFYFANDQSGSSIAVDRANFISVTYRTDIFGNEIYSNTYGIWGYDAYRDFVFDNNIYWNTYGIKLNNSAEWYIDDNRIYNNTEGINLYDSGTDYTIVIFPFGGIMINLEVNITFNNITDNIYGIVGNTSRNLKIFSNNISYNQNDGLFFDATQMTWVENNYMCFNNQSNLLFYDINHASGGSGQNNTCDYSLNWNDAGVVSGCLNTCIPAPPPALPPSPTPTSSGGGGSASQGSKIYLSSHGVYTGEKIYVYVYDQYENPISWVSVEVEGPKNYNIKSDNEGIVQFLTEIPGDYVVTVKKIGYQGQSLTVSVKDRPVIPQTVAPEVQEIVPAVEKPKMVEYVKPPIKPKPINEVELWDEEVKAPFGFEKLLIISIFPILVLLAAFLILLGHYYHEGRLKDEELKDGKLKKEEIEKSKIKKVKIKDKPNKINFPKLSKYKPFKSDSEFKQKLEKINKMLKL